jgi:recombinational DNA repair ATPase RecF
MQIHIQNFRGIEEARLQCSGVALITGTNATGKTSIAQAVAAVLTGNPIPMAGIRKNAAGMLVHTGAAQGQITLEGEDGTAMLSWPTAKVQTDGSPPQASAIAAGLESLADESRSANRARLLAPYLKADPT